MEPRKFYTLLLLLSIGSQLPAQQAPPIGNKKIAGEVNSGWYQSAVAGLQQNEYAFHSTGDRTCYFVQNSSQQNAFRIHADSYTAQALVQDADKWQATFKLVGVGRKNINWHPDNTFSISQQKSALQYQYNMLDIQYVNTSEGLRQNFIIKQKPSGKEHLRVQLSLSGNLQATLAGKTKLVLHTPGKPAAAQLTYEDLRVWDANQQPLEAEMQLQNQVLTIVVKDEHAVYPITIDPVNKNPDWKTSMDGLTSALSQLQLKAGLYGYTVTGLGDINNDGYGDAAISAPAVVDIFSGSGSIVSVGAVYLFYGSDTGLAKTPGKVLQPNSAVGALFGFSVDAGDVNNDGVNDVIIGAPLDQVSIVTGTSGVGTLTAQIGKVYIFPGGANLSASGSAIFTTLELSNSFINGYKPLFSSAVTNATIKPLFGFSVAVTEDLNGDNKKDIIVGAPGYSEIPVEGVAGLILAKPVVQTGAAFVYMSNSSDNTFSPKYLQAPTIDLLGLGSIISSLGLVDLRIGGLLFGFSVDGLGDYNNDNKNDVVVSAPAGLNLGSLSAALSGQILGGEAFVYFGTSNNISTTAGVTLQASTTGLLSNTANLFGFKVKGVRDATGKRNGNIIIGAPLAGAVPNLLNLSIKTGSVHIFKKKTSPPTGIVTSDQVLESPKPSNLLGILNNLSLSVLFGAAIDNAYDVDGDGNPDMVVGEPLSTGANLAGLQANAAGGAVYVFKGDGYGGYSTIPVFDVQATYGPDFLSVNATALFGYSVAGLPKVRGTGTTPRIIIGSPSGSLDFSSSLLNLGSTLNTLMSFTTGDNGVGKAYTFNGQASTLPAKLLDFSGELKNNTIPLSWTVTQEENLNAYEVERSSNAANGFTSIGLVFPKESGLNNTYTYTDTRPLQGTNFYRLKIVDKDGAYSYSNIIAIRTTGTGNGNITVINPVRDAFVLQCNGLEKGTYRVVVNNISGVLHQTGTMQVTQTQQVITIPKNTQYNTGLYWLNIYNNRNELVKSVKVLL
ncbi:MAG: integrin alpha [Chitinophagaceae bacterium]